MSKEPERNIITFSNTYSKSGAVNFFEESLFEAFRSLGGKIVSARTSTTLNRGDFIFYSLGIPNHALMDVYKAAPGLPIFNLICDHPLYYYPETIPPTYIPFVMDPACANFIMSDVQKIRPFSVCCLPTPGYMSVDAHRAPPASRREIEVLFVGSLELAQKIRTQWQTHSPHMAEALETACELMIHNKAKPLDIFAINGININQIDSSASLKILRRFFYYIDKYHRAYYREKILRVLAEAGIAVTVYTDDTDSFSSILPPGHKFRLYPQIAFPEMLKLMCQSKIVLSATYSNGDGGFSERVPSTMLNGAVSVSAYGNYANQYFNDQEDILFYDINQIQALPDIVNALLNDKQKLDKIAVNGSYKAKSGHLPEHRAQKIFEFVDRLYCSGDKV